jgi:hypothetical protein
MTLLISLHTIPFARLNRNVQYYLVRSIICFFLSILGVTQHVMASSLSDAINKQREDTWVTREVRLSDLGLKEPVVLNGLTTSRDFYLPVPKEFTLQNASVSFEATYLKGDNGPLGLYVSVDGRPQLSQKVTDRDGAVSKKLVVSPEIHKSGFVRLGVTWQSAADVSQCGSGLNELNALSIQPQSKLTYRYNAQEVSTLTQAFEVLPNEVSLLVAGQKIVPESFDSAWRFGLVLERADKHVFIRAFPAIGDTVATDDIEIPTDLLRIPAFLVLKGQSKYQIKSAAELGALIFLNAQAVRSDIAIMDAALFSSIDGALKALRVQLESDPDALRAFDAWTAERVSIVSQPIQIGQVRTASMGRRPIIVIANDVGDQAAGIFDSYWRNILISRQVTAYRATMPDLSDAGKINLDNLGGTYTSFDVKNHGIWSLNFPLTTVAKYGQMPDELVMDVAAAPGASGSSPIASVFWNDILLVAQRLRADGEPEKISTRIPGYALGITNNVVVRFQRQPVTNGCAEEAQAYPVDVLPTSYMKLGHSVPDGSFVGVLPALAHTPELLIPDRYLLSAPTSLKNTMIMALASGLPATRTKMIHVPNSESYAPGQAFVSMEVPLKDSQSVVQLIDQTGLRIGGKNTPWINIAGLEKLSAAELITSSGHEGVYWQSLGDSNENIDPHFVLNKGNLVIIGPKGPIAWIDSNHPDAGEARAPGSVPFYEWRQYMQWTVPMVGVLLLGIVFLLIVARRMANKRKSKNQG